MVLLIEVVPPVGVGIESGTNAGAFADNAGVDNTESGPPGAVVVTTLEVLIMVLEVLGSSLSATEGL